MMMLTTAKTVMTIIQAPFFNFRLEQILVSSFEKRIYFDIGSSPSTEQNCKWYKIYCNLKSGSLIKFRFEMNQ